MGFLISGVMGLFVLMLVIGASIFWIWAIVDCVKNTRLSDSERVAWVLVVIFLHFLGALIYLVAGRGR